MTDVDVLQPSAPTEVRRVVGTRAARKEDGRLLRGAGQYTGDVGRPHVAEMAVARCPFPHARISAIRTDAALRIPGVYHVLTGSDASARSGSIGLLRPDPGAPRIPLPPLAVDVATFEGQGVVSVAAVTRHVAEDAIQAIEIDYEPLPHVTDVPSALAPGAPVIYPDRMLANLLTETDQGSGDVANRLREADVVVEGRFVINRVSGLPMETRVVLAEWQPGANELTVHVSSQTPHLVRRQLAELLGLPEGSVRVVTKDVGGGFGLKLGAYPEDILASLHAMALRRPVRWVEDRSEHFRATTHARESIHEYRIGARADGTILAMDDIYTNDLGAASFSFGASQQSTIVFSGPYRVTDGHVGRRVVVTNKTPAGAYRGFGQPEVNFAYERLIDRLARRLNMDPVELRARNMLKADELPWINPVGAIYDSGDYERSLRIAASAIGYDSHRSSGRQRPDGRLGGIGFSAYVERTGTHSSLIDEEGGALFGAHESVTIRADYSGAVDVYSGVSSFGQGSETVFAQICSEFIGVDLDRVTVHVGDTASSPLNTGGFASRTVIAAAGALQAASGRFRDKMLRIAAWMMGFDDPSALEVSGDQVRCRDDPGRAVPVKAIFARAIIGEGLPPGESPGLDETAYFSPSHAAYAFGTAAALVAVDATTGEFGIERIVVVHDSGTPINPTLVEGQVRGGIVQALGAALSEELRYDDSGQLVNGTMMDYFAPLACDIPPIELISTDIPSPVTPLGIRGAGESGTIPVAAAVANAICDALADFGVELDQLPITPEVVWKALRAAKGN